MISPGNASLNPWHVDEYNLQLPISIEDLMLHIADSENRDDGLRWNIIDEGIQSTLSFEVFRTGYIGFAAVNSVALCDASDSESGVNLNVKVRVSNRAIVGEVIAIIVMLLIIWGTPDISAKFMLLIAPIVVGWAVLCLIQVRRRDPPNVLVEALLASVEAK